MAACSYLGVRDAAAIMPRGVGDRARSKT
jgi:hypothetical protein